MIKGRTDLAIEAHDYYRSVDVETAGTFIEDKRVGEIEIKRVYINDDAAAQEMGKPVGLYSTMFLPSDLHKQHTEYENAIAAMCHELTNMIKVKENDKLLVVGLGNSAITADALGPKSVEQVLVTRHLYGELPREITNKLRSVSAISPGVLGVTGIETAEIIRGVADRVEPDIIFAIDALAARNICRVANTIQLADTGISPGSGVGNKRAELSRASLGVPVIAIGVPTVIDVSVIADEAIELTEEYYNDDKHLNCPVINDEDKAYIIEKLLTKAYEQSLIVTPKEIDVKINDISSIIANAINISMHKGLTFDDINKYK